MKIRILFPGALLIAVSRLLAAPARAEPPAVSAKAPDFTLSTPEGKPVQLSALTSKSTVVLIVLRGYPGYQCPYCQKQAHDFQVHAGEFAAKGVELLLVYPGPRADLGDHAKEFLAPEGALPANYHLVLDPDYSFTNLYGLRWDAENETAYPATFIVDRKGVVVFSAISRIHGGRTTAQETLAALSQIK